MTAPIFGRFGLVPGRPTIKVQAEAGIGAGNTDLEFGPAADSGEKWIVAWFLYFHEDDHANRNIQARIKVGATDAGMNPVDNDAQLTYRNLYEEVANLPVPFVLDEDCHIVVRGVDITAAHHVEARALVYVISGASKPE